jgi:serine/threonine protein kinase/TPR repeat protein
MSDRAYPDAMPPQYRLHWYVLERVLGQGGFGITYLARDTNLDQLVAIKEYLPVDVATRRPDGTVRSRTEEQHERYRGGLERFIREARTLARFDHPNIVRVHSVFEFNDTAYMVMRFEEGQTLAALLERRQAMPEAELMQILLPILDGLDLVHNAGFIHRDIKPDNIHIRADGSPVLLDFGSARHALGHARTVTILIAPGYAPFEQYYSSGESQGAWTDIYGLGATCYRAIAGRAPIDAIARSKGILGSTKEMLLPAAVVGNGRYSERLLKAVDHALEFAENDRPQSIREWRGELVGEAGVARQARALDAATDAPRQPSPPRGGAASAAAVPAPHNPRQTLWLTMRVSLIWGTGAAAAIIAALAVLPTFLPTGRESGRDATPREARAAPAPVADGADALRGRLAALEQELAQQKRQAEERDRMSQPKPAPAKPVAAAPARTAPLPTRPVPARAGPAAVESRLIPPAVIERLAESDVPKTATPAPAAPSATELLASADRTYARGNHSEAVATLKALAERNYARAMVRLGDLYLQGEGVERSDKEALNLFRRAANQGDSDARLRLGDMYAIGRGVPQNNFQAYVWYSAAALSGNTAAKANQERMAALLQPVEVQQAGKLVERMARSPKEK